MLKFLFEKRKILFFILSLIVAGIPVVFTQWLKKKKTLLPEPELADIVPIEPLAAASVVTGIVGKAGETVVPQVKKGITAALDFTKSIASTVLGKVKQGDTK